MIEQCPEDDVDTVINEVSYTPCQDAHKNKKK